MKNFSVIGTGLSGLIGTRLQQLHGEKYDFQNLDITSGVDITKLEVVDQILKSSQSPVVIHLAAYTNLPEAQKQKGDKNGLCYQLNVTGTKNIVSACQKHKKYLIHVSTDFVFDGTKGSAYTEEDQPNPIDWYGETKYLAEQEVFKNLNEFVILRLSFPYLANPMRPDLVQKITDQLNTNTLPPQFTDNLITPTFADDFCNLIHTSIQQRPHGIYHAVGSSSHSSYDIALMIKEKFNLRGEIRKGTVKSFTQSTGRPFPLLMQTSNRKLTRDLNMTMKTFPQGLDAVKQQLSVSATS